MDTTTPVYGSVDKKTQRAAWTIGKKSRRVFEAGIFNLTKPEAPVLVHFGTKRTEQWLLVRVENPKESESNRHGPVYQPDLGMRSSGLSFPVFHGSRRHL